MFVLVLLSAAATAAPDHPPGILPAVRCATPAFAGLAWPEPVPMPGPPPPPAVKGQRDVYGVSTNVLYTDNFAFRWGSGGGVSTGEVERLAQAFEDAWLEEVDVQGHPVPYGADDYLFNVYIGDTGGGTPSGYGAAGYFTSDASGWPMVVVAAGTLDNPDYADITAAHEFYHAIQGGTGRYEYAGDSAWFWEASATWASATVYPSNLYYASFMFGYAFLPHFPVNYFNYADSWNVEDYYQYGAFIVPFHLSEITADRSLIRDVWTAAGPEDDPVSMLQRLMDERGLSFSEAFVDHAARMATFDYDEGATYEYMAEVYADSFREYDNMVAAEVGPSGTGGLVDGPRSLRPYRYGYNAIRIDVGDATEVEVVVEGEAEGSRRSDAVWGGKLVTRRGASRTYTDLAWSGTTGSASLSGLSGETVWLVVAAWTDETRYFDTEQFAYQYRVDIPDSEEPVDPEEPDDTGEPTVPDDTAAPDDTDLPGEGDDDTGSAGTVGGDTDKGSVSSCSTASAAGFGAMWMGLLGIIGRRRRGSGAADGAVRA